jgi:hypothetical protein
VFQNGPLVLFLGAALERTINSFATDSGAVLAGPKLISTNSERWRHKDRHRHHKLLNVNVLADTKAILLAKQVITRVYSTKRSAHSPRSTLLFSRLWGWLLGHIALLCSVLRTERNALLVRRSEENDCQKKFGGG